MAATLWISVALAWAAAAVFLTLGVLLIRRRPPTEPAQLANVAFAAWWFSVATSNVVTGLRILLAALDIPLTLLVGLSFITNAAVTMGLAGLLYYLVYLLTGRSFLAWPLVVFYALFCGWLIRSTAAWEPVGIEVTRWGTAYAYAHPITDDARIVALAFLVGPQLLTVIALLVLALRLPWSASRLRLLVVATAIFAWFGATVAATAAGLDSGAWQALRQLIPIAVGLAVLIVHRPPPWLPWRMPPEIATPSRRGAT